MSVIRDPTHRAKIIFDDVKYSEKFPELNYLRLYGKTELVKNIIFVKFDDWSHEEEYRIFRKEIPASLVGYDRKIMTRVVFGCKCSDDEFALVKSWLQGWPSDVILSKTCEANDGFELKVVDFDCVKGVGVS